MHILLIAALLVLVVLLAVAVFVLFHGRMVNMEKWHAWTRDEQDKLSADIVELKAWVKQHVHLHTASPAAIPSASAAKK